MTEEDTDTGGVEPVNGPVNDVVDDVVDEAAPGAGETAATVGARGRRRPGRRRPNAPGGRHHAHKVRVTPEEEAQLLQLALAQRLTVPRLLVEAALAGSGEGAAATRAVLEELFAVHRLLATIANNVNQIARATNANLEGQPETYATLAAVRRTAERIDATLDELGAAGSSGTGGTGGTGGAG